MVGKEYIIRGRVKKTMKAKVIEVIDGDTFKISPRWEWNGQKGDLVRPTGYDTPEKGSPKYIQLTNKLKALILGKLIELKTGYKIDRGRLVCDVYFNGKHLAEYFPEYKV